MIRKNNTFCSTTTFCKFLQLSIAETNKTKKTYQPHFQAIDKSSGGDGETRTLAPVSQPTPLAGAPRHQLEYISKW